VTAYLIDKSYVFNESVQTADIETPNEGETITNAARSHSWPILIYPGDRMGSYEQISQEC
jgi:hypothetical protein